MDIKTIISHGENKVVEFKEQFTNNLYKTVIAFSNTAGGKILIGVNDKREIIGLNDDINIFDLKDSIVNHIDDRCTPSIFPDIYTVYVSDKVICVIDIKKGQDLPYFEKNKGKELGTYMRIGSTNRIVELEAIQELERQKRHIGFDELVRKDYVFEDLDLRPLYTKFKEIGKDLKQSDLLNLKLIYEENNQLFPTNGLLILLGILDNVTIKCALFKGNDMSIFVDRKEYKGDLFSQIDATESFIINYLKLSSTFNGMQRVDTLEIPIEVLKESIMNAIIHRDYSRRGSDIKVALFDDMLNIVSPGEYLIDTFPIDMSSGRSEIRNPVIARVFKELNYIETWGSGLPRILNACMKKGLKHPSIEEKGKFVDLKIYRIQEEYPVEIEIENLSVQEETVMKYLNANESLRTSDLSQVLKVKDRRVRNILKALVDKGLIENIGHTTTSAYRIKKHKS